MEVEFAGDGDPVAYAREIHAQLGWRRGPVDVEAIAHALDITEIRREPLDTFEGGMIPTADRNCGMILVNSRSPTTRQRFTLAHELLHFLNDRHVRTTDAFECRKSDIGFTGPRAQPVLRRHAEQEREANTFAIELLAPRNRLTPYLRQHADLGAIVDLRRELKVSAAALARRFIELHDDPVAMIASQNGRVKYAVTNEGAVPLALRPGDPMPWTPRRGPNGLSRIERVEAPAFLASPPNLILTAQTLYQRDGHALTLLTFILDEYREFLTPTAAARDLA